MKKILLIAALWLLSSAALAQAPQTVRLCNGSQANCPLIGASNPLPVTGALTTFAPATTGSPISVTTGGVTGTLPAGAVVVATNVGTTNAAYCKLGASATTSDQYIAPNGGWFAYTVGVATQLTCITSSSTTTVNMVGGSGLPTGTGGGSGGSGGGGGAVTIASGAVASGAYSSGSIASGAFASGSIGSGAVASGAIASGALAVGAGADGWNVTQGAKADSVCATDTGTCSEIALLKKSNQNTSAPLTDCGANPCTNNLGNTALSFRTPQLTRTVISAASSGDNTIITRSTGTIKVYGIFVACASPVVVTFKNGATGVSGAMTLSTFFLPRDGEAWFVTTSTNNFIMNLGSAVQCSGTAYSLEN